MKKYITPAIKAINLNTENLIAGSFGVYSDPSNKENQLSNRRSASSVIWGFDDEAIVEDEY